MKRLFLFAILFAVQCFGAITLTGSAEAATTSGTFSATNSGDLKIVYAYRNQSDSTVPSLPSGWTSIGTVTDGGGNTMRVGCNKSSSSGDTGTGTWTNANALVGVSYSGSNVGTTVNCNTTGIGNTATNTGGGTTHNFPAITVQNSSNWVDGSTTKNGNGGTNNVCTPAGMTQHNEANGSSAVININDTNGAVSSWSSTNCVTFFGGPWISYVAEVKILVIVPGGGSKRKQIFERQL